MNERELKTMMRIQWAYFVNDLTYTSVCPKCHNVEYWGIDDLQMGGGSLYCHICEESFDIFIDDETRKKLDKEVGKMTMGLVKFVVNSN